jgi:hypothetical protein
MPRKPKRKRKPVRVEAHGIRIRLFRRGANWHADIRLGSERLRAPLKTTDKDTAEANAEKLAEEIAKRRLLGVRPDTLTLGQLFTAYRQHRAPDLKPGRLSEAKARIAMFLEAWGADLLATDIGQTRVDAYCTARRSLRVVAPAMRLTDEGKRRRGYRTPRSPRDGALDGEFRFLNAVLNWATTYRDSGRRLLTENPLRGCEWPKEKNPRRPVASHDRYNATQEHTDTVDPKGRLRCIVALARYTGRRESALCALHASDLLLSARRIRAALADAGMDERLAAHMPHGAIRWRAESDKQGFLHISPIAPDARAELDTYLARQPRMGDVPLFPAPGRRRKKNAPPSTKPEQPMSRDTAAKWLLRAEQLAELPKLRGGVFHPYRRLWATERKHMPDVDVAAAGGWRDTQALRGSYQHADPATVLKVVLGT